MASIERSVLRFVFMQLVILAGLPGVATAQERTCGGKTLVEAHQRGIMLYGEREVAGEIALRQAMLCFSVAAESAKAAQQKGPDPDLRHLEASAERALGRCHVVLHDLAEARAHLERALALTSAPERRTPISLDLGRVILNQAREAVSLVDRCTLAREAEQVLPAGERADASQVAEQACAARPWKVEIASEPMGARVAIDGLPACTATPCTVELRRGKHQAVLEKARHDPTALQFEVTGEGTKVQGRLSPRFGRVTLTTSPPGVDVYVDGEAEPSDPERELDPGLHRAEVKDLCFKGAPVSFEVKAAKWSTTTIELERRRTAILVEAAAGAPESEGSVYVDEAYQGTLPLRGEALACASELRVEGSGGTWRAPLALRGQRSARIEVPAWVTTPPPPPAQPPLPPERGGYYFGVSNTRLRDTRLHLGWMTPGTWQVGADVFIGDALATTVPTGSYREAISGGLELLVQRRLGQSVFVVASSSFAPTVFECRSGSRAQCAAFMRGEDPNHLTLSSWAWTSTAGLKVRFGVVRVGVGASYSVFGFKKELVDMGRPLGTWLWLGIE